MLDDLDFLGCAYLEMNDIKQIQQKTSIQVWLPYVVLGRFGTDIHSYLWDRWLPALSCIEQMEDSRMHVACAVSEILYESSRDNMDWF